MSVELHLPDLPEVPISFGQDGAAAVRVDMPWHLRARAAVSAYFPLLLMTLLALATWWLVKNSPRAPVVEEARAVSAAPDYTMSGFALERFDATGRLKLRIEGEQMRHFPATDRIEIDGAVIRAIAPDGRVTLAHAQRATANGDGSEVQLLGGAEVTSEREGDSALVMRSEFLHAFFVTERVRSHLPVQVQMGATDLKAAGLDYDHAVRRLELKGPLRAVMAPAAANAAVKSTAKRR
jgi:lipopolysaccharide export system protein LptC